MSELARFGLGLVLGACVSACFAEGNSGEGHATGGTTGGECPVGARGCPCTGGDGCDIGLQCHAPSGLCFDPQCERGTEACECLDGQCVGMLECREQLCQPMMPTSTSGADATSSGSVADSGTTIDPSTGTIATEGIDVTGGDPCSMCIDDAWANECAAAHDACVMDPEMKCGLARSCGEGPMVTSGLCCPLPPGTGSTTLYNALLSCTANYCEDACGDIMECPA